MENCKDGSECKLWTKDSGLYKRGTGEFWDTLLVARTYQYYWDDSTIGPFSKFNSCVIEAASVTLITARFNSLEQSMRIGLRENLGSFALRDASSF